MGDHAEGSALEELVERARGLDKHAVSRLIGVFEDSRPESAPRRARALDLLDTAAGGEASPCTVLGVTGTPGSGKSSLLARVTVEMLRAEPELTVAVLAIDPSSAVSGGALLGDRTRMRSPLDDRRLFFRSQASAAELGGLSPSSFQVCRLLTRLFRCVLVETVGIGQSEADVRHLADRVYLVLQPLGGDEVQFLKAGIVEVPDAFVLNKCDEPTAGRSYHHLTASLGLARPFDAEPPEVHRTSARTGLGVPELAAALLDEVATGTPRSHAEREPHFLERWVDDEWGRQGRRHLAEALGGAGAVLASAGGFDQAQQAFDSSLRAALAGG
ncbi:MAG TPA: methylmalonyl Co-A mutase-associated GTPase MeaB [Acidimicrobiales bacterium]|nr:methylmalonyl Co-A mutase-associated GTPase MeaB [Acidimicrobiales bacterium]